MHFMTAPGKKKQCPYCDEEIPISATICRYCREELPEARKKRAKKKSSPLDAPPPPEPETPKIWEEEDGPATYGVVEEPAEEAKPRRNRSEDEDEEEDDAPRSKRKKPSLVEQFDQDAEARRRGRKLRFAHCPACGSRDAKRIIWTLWGSFWGPLILCHVRCQECGTAYNGRSGDTNTTGIVLFLLFNLLLGGGLAALGVILAMMFK
jgi:hypothetical protein